MNQIFIFILLLCLWIPRRKYAIMIFQSLLKNGDLIVGGFTATIKF